MRKIYSPKDCFGLVLAIIILSFNLNYAFATDFYPNAVTIGSPATYCVGAAGVIPITGSFTQTSCTGSSVIITVTYKWFYNSTNSTTVGTATLVSTGTVLTTAAGGAVTIPSIVPSVALAGPYFYFCQLSWGVSGCAPADTIYSNTNLIVVGPPVLVSATAAPDSVCDGFPITFTGIASGATTYLWTGPTGSGYTSTLQNPAPYTVNITDAGVYTFTATNPCGSTTVHTLPVVVNTQVASVTATASPLAVCVGGSITLTGTSTGGTGVHWLWTGPGGYSSTLLNPPPISVLTILSTGVYTLTAVAGGCPPVSAVTGTVIVEAVPTGVTANIARDTLCIGDSIRLSGTATNGFNYLWTGPNGYTSTLLNPPPFADTSLLQAGVYSLTVSSACGTVTATTLALVVYATPDSITGLTNKVCVGSSINFGDLTNGGIWSISNGTGSATTNILGTVTGTSSGTATLTYSLTNVHGTCFVTAPIIIGAPAGPVFGPNVLCTRDSILLTDATPGGIWSSSSVAIATVGSNSGETYGVSGGIVTITYTTPGCPPSVHNVTVNTSPAIINGLRAICNGSQIKLWDTVLGGVWTSSNNAIATVTSLPPDSASVRGLSVGVVDISYTIGNNCSAIAVISIDTLPNLTISGPDLICKGECAPLAVVPTVRTGVFLWLPSTGISCTNCGTVNACPLEDQTYTVVVTDSAHCRDTLYHKLAVKTLPVITYAPDPFFICRGTPKMITAYSDSSVSGMASTYTWEPNYLISALNIQNPTLTTDIDLVYTVIVTSQYGCKDSIKVPVSILDSAFTAISPDTIICIGNNAHLFVTSTDPRTRLLWAPSGSLNNDTLYNPIATPTVTTTYSVNVTENACFSVTRYTTVFVDPLPAIQITRPAAQIAGTVVTLTGVITNSDTAMIYAWTPPETVSCPSCGTTEVIPTVTTTYTLCITSNRGCLSCDTVTIRLFCDNSQVFIPNTFTPNGDGMNDRFYISGKGLGLITEFYITNRWGQVLYNVQNIPANDASFGWDGTFKGQILEPDVFMYYAVILCETDGVAFKFHGDISIVR